MSRTIALLSDSTGNLGEYFVRALISQFPPNSFDLRVFSFIKDKSEVEHIFQKLESQTPVIFHTTLFSEMKKKIRAMAKSRGWPEYDLTGGAMKFLEKTTHQKAFSDLHAVHELNQEYERRITAINFTVEHDDGLSGSTLAEADIALAGVSRTSKTPTSIFLANKGYKVANIPIILGSTLHEKIKKYPLLRVVGLTINADRLQEIRKRRMEQTHIFESDYFAAEAIDEELKIARLFFAEIGCPVIDVTHHAVEETAALVLNALHLR